MVTLQVYSEINNTIIEILKSRQLKDETFAQIFKSAFVLASLDGREAPVIPRLAGRQKQRNNSPADTAEEYWRLSVFIPFLDSLILELKCRFQLSHRRLQALLLLPSNLHKLLPSDIRDIRSVCEPDLLESITLNAEVERWQKSGSKQTRRIVLRLSSKPCKVSMRELIQTFIASFIY